MVGALCMGDIRRSLYRNGHALYLDGPHGTARAWLRRRRASLSVAEDSQNPANAPRCARHELLVELLVLLMIIKVVKETLVFAWIMGKGQCSRRTKDQCSCNGQRSSHGRFPRRDAFGVQHRFHDTLLRRPSQGCGN